MRRLHDLGGELAAAPTLALGADERGVALGSAEHLDRRVQRDEALAALDEVEQRLFLLRRERRVIAVEDQRVVVLQRSATSAAAGVSDRRQLDAAPRERRRRAPGRSRPPSACGCCPGRGTAPSAAVRRSRRRRLRRGRRFHPRRDRQFGDRTATHNANAPPAASITRGALFPNRISLAFLALLSSSAPRCMRCARQKPSRDLNSAPAPCTALMIVLSCRGGHDHG